MWLGATAVRRAIRAGIESARLAITERPSMDAIVLGPSAQGRYLCPRFSLCRSGDTNKAAL
jgi:hypothetical protein